MYLRNGRWYSDFWFKGERYTKSHGPVNKTVAKERDGKFRADVAAGIYMKEKDNPPFDKGLDQHLKKSKTENTESSYKRNLLSARHLKAFFGGNPVSTIQNNQVLMRKYMNQRKTTITEMQLKRGRNKSELSYTSINRELALMRSMFNVLILAGKVNKNPVSLVTLFEETQKERVLTLDETERIFKAIDEADKRYKHLKDIVIIGLNTAMRSGEIMGAKKSWVDLKNSVIVVPKGSQKRKKKDKRVPINSVLIPVIRRLMRDNKGSEYLIVNPRTGTRFTTIQNGWDGILKKAGILGKPGVDKLRIHDIRHSAATNLARAGKDMKFIAQYLGHSDVRTSARYVHYSDDDLKEGSEVLAQVPSKFTTPKLKKVGPPASS